MEKSLDCWLAWLEQQHPNAIDLGLDRVLSIAKKLKIHKTDCFVVTVAGTNGKGSTIAILESICLAAGLRVGTYTSPHINEYCERIKINGQNVAEDKLCNHFSKVTAFNDDKTLTYFEYGTLAALSIFKDEPLDILLLEVGMGGRLDAVNIIDSDLAIITHIDLDHMDWLGETREAIGAEKAGIFRPMGKAICGDFDPPDSVLNHAKKLKVDLSLIQRDFSYLEENFTWSWSSNETQYQDLPKPKLRLDNAAVALQAIELMKDDFQIDLKAITKGLLGANLLGRQQIIPGKPTMIMDVAHNPDACRVLAEEVRNHSGSGQIFALVGMLDDKDFANCFYPFDDLVHHWFLVDLKVQRAAKTCVMLKNLPKCSRSEVRVHDSMVSAWENVCETANDDDLIVVFGSFHTVALVFDIMSHRA